MNDFYYKNIFLYSSLQFSGHIEEYFAKHTRKLVVFIVMPRLQNKFNLLRIYKRGKLEEQKRVWSSENLLLYYAAWYIHYWQFLLQYFDRREKFAVISTHPISFFGSFLQKRFRRVTFAYWIGDYFPPVNLSLRLFEWIKKYYHGKIAYRYYLSDRLNLLYNGKLFHSENNRTVMWGVKPKQITRLAAKNTMSLLFVGLIKESQGLELIFKFLKDNADFLLTIIGICEKPLYQKYMTIIKKNRLEKRVFFPNRFYSDGELDNISTTCQVGIAMYKTSSLNATYYTDPGKVKAYLEMGLPVIMSETSSIATYIQKFHCGEVINWSVEAMEHAFDQIRENYHQYGQGVNKFNRFFYYERYYKTSFRALEHV